MLEAIVAAGRVYYHKGSNDLSDYSFHLNAGKVGVDT